MPSGVPLNYVLGAACQSRASLGAFVFLRRFAIKWFKHISGSLNNSIISEAIERFGGDGYMVFFGILEMVSDEFNIYNPGILTLRMKKITKNLQLSRQKTVKILRFFDEKAKTNKTKDVSFLVDIQKHNVVINCKRLAELCDNHTQKLLKDTSKSLQSEIEATSLQEEEVEEEVDIKEKSIKEKVGYPDWLNISLWEEYKLHRKEIKAKMTLRAEKMAIKNLKELIDAGGDQNKIIEKSIFMGWKGLFALDDDTTQELKPQTYAQAQDAERRQMVDSLMETRDETKNTDRGIKKVTHLLPSA